VAEKPKESEWLRRRNERALARFNAALPERFPKVVLRHALQARWTPALPSRAVEAYWRAHPLRADRLARALARLSGAPEGWRWESAEAAFRAPPAPYREAAFDRGPGHCCVCGQPVYRFGWHRPLAPNERPNGRARWHAPCVAAWKFWSAPSDQVRILKRVQKRRCAATGGRLLRGAEVDHKVPLFRVRREHREAPWPDLLAFWGAPNLQVVNRGAHVEKCAAEAADRARSRSAGKVRPEAGVPA
jgi:hypothetical protein